VIKESIDCEKQYEDLMVGNVSISRKKGDTMAIGQKGMDID